MVHCNCSSSPDRPVPCPSLGSRSPACSLTDGLEPLNHLGQLLRSRSQVPGSLIDLFLHTGAEGDSRKVLHCEGNPLALMTTDVMEKIAVSLLISGRVFHLTREGIGSEFVLGGPKPRAWTRAAFGGQAPSRVIFAIAREGSSCLTSPRSTGERLEIAVGFMNSVTGGMQRNKTLSPESNLILAPGHTAAPAKPFGRAMK